MAGEIASGQLADGLLASEAPRLRDPLVDQHDQLFAVAHRPEAQRPGPREVAQHVIAALARRGQPALPPHGHQVIAAQPPPARQRVHGQFAGPFEFRRAESQAGTAGG
ncbi:hypothetical protein Pta02_16040 [Planobispora takensis]|uniref:Uncharacterized protein n=1 Tax=Planobispora takensis TaxID=1367882 RepID=A0A8J3SVM3_9ACTN|nr:hypothetical protein Pta02_16040 [Planobispora takensis]